MARTTKGDPAIRQCLDAFHAGFVRRFNPPDLAERFLSDPDAVPRSHLTMPTIAPGKDAALMKHLIAAHGAESVLRMIDLYFGAAAADARVVTSDQTVGAFYALASYLATRHRRPQGSRTIDNLDAATRATQKQEVR